MKLGLQLGYWGAQPPENARGTRRRRRGGRLRRRLHRRGLGLGRLHPAGLVGFVDAAGSGSAPRSCSCPRAPRPPARWHALTLDHLRGGRLILGLGVSGPQVVEGWYGQPFPKPLARTREYVDIIRQVLAREAPVTSDGPHYPLPLTGRGRDGSGQAAQADHAPAARRHPDHARRRGAEERRAGRRDRRRLAADLLHAAHGRHVQRLARRGLRPPGCAPQPRGLRDLRDRQHRHHRRPRRRRSRR